MLYRALILGIICFWAVMMVQLVRLETHPDSTDILDVPVPYVVGVMFRYGQLSLLNIRDGSKSIGSMEVRPSTTGSDGRALNLSGSLDLPGQEPFNFDGLLKMDSSSRLRAFRMDVAVRKQNYHVLLTGDMATKTLHYETLVGGQITSSQSLPMEPTALEHALAQNLGLDPRMIPLGAAGIAPPDITARETQITLRSGELQVYEITVAEAGAPLLDLYMTQLGQVVLAKTSFGYTLSAEDWE
jgi:hypothetical protein